MAECVFPICIRSHKGVNSVRQHFSHTTRTEQSPHFSPSLPRQQVYLFSSKQEKRLKGISRENRNGEKPNLDFFLPPTHAAIILIASFVLSHLLFCQVRFYLNRKNSPFRIVGKRRLLLRLRISPFFCLLTPLLSLVSISPRRGGTILPRKRETPNFGILL